jgi:hypothetical protein
MRVVGVALALAAALVTERLHAQTGADTSIVAARHAVTVNVLGLIVGAYSAEYAHAVGRRLTLGASATRGTLYIYRENQGTSQERTYAADMRLNAYIEGTRFQGLAAVLQAGVYRERYAQRVGVGTEARTDSLWATIPTVGFAMEYAFSRATPRSLLLVVGAGAKRAVGGQRRTMGPYPFNLNASLGGLF